MLAGVLTALAVLGAIGLLVVLFLQRGRDGMDLSLGGLLRVYLYLASLAGVVAFTIGLAGIISYLLAAAFGLDVIYGGQPQRPIPAIAPACPPNTTCPPFVTPFPEGLIPDDRVRRQTEDLVRGVTFVIFGGVFWGAHWSARRALAESAERAGGLHRAYLILGTAIFGIATIALLPMGIYQALSFALVPASQFSYRPGAGEALSGGLAALPLWLAYLWLVQRALRAAPPPPPTVA
ncbi:MAG: DUF5671 domain-containing protein [Candidatus Limnocylindria bacterium]